jgi:hypothetical protein
MAAIDGNRSEEATSEERLSVRAGHSSCDRNFKMEPCQERVCGSATVPGLRMDGGGEYNSGGED